MKTWLCVICGLIYDEAAGWPADGIAAGTRWEDVPQDWVCPECKVGKSDFDMIEMGPCDSVVASCAPAPAPLPAILPRQPIVIIGSGHAGYGLAAALRKADPNIDIRIMTQDDGVLYSKPSLSIGLAQGKSAQALAGESALAIEKRLDIRVYPHCRVERIDSQARRLITSLGEMEYGQLVLASGAQPIRPEIEGDQQAMLNVNSLRDYQCFRERLAGVRRIAILGDGLIGCEFANDLLGSGFEVSIIGLGQWPMARLLPAAAGAALQAALGDCGAQWYLQNTVQRIERAEQGYRLSLADGQHLDADLVLSAVGLTPDLALARSAGIVVGRGVMVDAQLRTSQPAIYALGDCIEIAGQLLPYLAPIARGIEALSKTLLGQPTAVNYPLMPVTVKTPAMPVCLLPPGIDDAGEWQCTLTSDGLHARFFDARGAMRGFVLLGQEAQAQRHVCLQTCQNDLLTAA